MIFDPVISDPTKTDPLNPPGLRSILLKSENENILGTLFIAGGEGKKPTVLLLHGFPGNENNFDIAHAICRFGWNVIVFHYRGTWGSKGIFCWQNAINDVRNVIELIKNGWFINDLKIDAEKIAIIGHSMGGFFSANALVEGLTEHAFVIGMFNLGFIGEMISGNPGFQEVALESLKHGSTFLETTGPEKLLDEMIKNGHQWNLINHAQILAKKNFYMIGASKDQTSPVDMHFHPLLNILKKIEPEKNFGEILETGHSFSDRRITLTKKIVNWLSEIKFQD